MQNQLNQRDGDVPFRRYEYDDAVVFVGDLGAGVVGASVDVVDGSAIVVVESERGRREREFELPDGAAKAFINNGVVTIEIER